MHPTIAQVITSAMLRLKDANIGDSATAIVAAQDESTPQPILEDLYWYTEDLYWYTTRPEDDQQYYAPAPPSIDVYTAPPQNFNVGFWLAANPNISLGAISRMFASRSHLKVLAGNPSTPPDILRKMADRSDFEIRCGVAGNPHTPSDILSWLWHSPFGRDLEKWRENILQSKLAGNTSSPPKLLAEFVGNYYNSVAFNKMYFAYPHVDTVKEALLGNSSVPEAAKVWLRNGGFADMELVDFLSSTS